MKFAGEMRRKDMVLQVRMSEKLTPLFFRTARQKRSHSLSYSEAF
jgi:hypothetical protein